MQKFKSLYKEGEVTAPNFIAELIFQKRSEFFNSGSLPQNFWNSKKHQGVYKGVVIQASKLLNNYSVYAVISALKDPKAKFIFKLSDKKLMPLIEYHEKHQPEVEIKEVDEYHMSKPQTFTNKKSKLSDL